MEAFVETRDNFMKWGEAKGTEVETFEGKTCFGIGVVDAKLVELILQYTLAIRPQ